MVSDNGIRGGVRLVKAIAGEFFEQVENLVRLGLGNIVFLVAAFDERLALLRHFDKILFTHRTAQQIRAAKRVAGEQLRGLHHLLLINQDAVGLPGNLFEQRMLVFHFDFTMAPFNEITNQFHRAGTVQRHERSDVLDGADLKLFAQFANPTGFQLEHAQCFRTVQQVVGFFVVERQVINVNGVTLRALDHFAGVADDSERFQAEKIHLQQTEFTDGVHRILRDERAAFVQLERQEIHERFRTDDDACGVHTSVSREILEDKRGVNQLAGNIFVLVSLLQFRHLLERLRQIHLQVGGNQFCKPVTVTVRQTHHASDIAHNGFRAHRAEGDDLRHGIASIFFTDVFNHIRAAVIGKINVNIRRADALRIQKAFEQQRIADGIHVGDFQ